MAVSNEYVYTDKHIEHTVKQGEATRKQTLPSPKGEWMTPAAAERYIAKQSKAGKDKIVYSTMDPSVGIKPLTMTMVRQGETSIEVLGKSVPAIKWTQTVSAMPIETTFYADEEGGMLRTTMNMGPGMTFTIVKTEESIAKAKVNPPELMASTLIKPEGEIKKPRATTSAIYELTFTKGKAMDLPWSGSFQTKMMRKTSTKITNALKTSWWCN